MILRWMRRRKRVRLRRRGGYERAFSYEFRAAIAVVFISPFVARATDLSQERIGRAFRLRSFARRAQFARRADARARGRQSCGGHDLRACVDRGDLPDTSHAAGQRRGPRRASAQYSGRVARPVLSLRYARTAAALHRALDAHGAAPRRGQAQNLRPHADARDWPLPGLRSAAAGGFIPHAGILQARIFAGARAFRFPDLTRTVAMPIAIVAMRRAFR